MKIATLYFDGGIRQGICAYGWLLKSESKADSNGRIFASEYRTCGPGTSNIAEYRALIAGLQGALKHKIDIVYIVGDSQLIVKQVIGSFKTKKPELIKYRDYVLKLLERFKGYTIKWVPRNENKQADALVDQAFDIIFMKTKKRN